MICPICKAEGEKSTIHVGMQTRTLMGWTPYYDEDGVLHDKDPNWTTTSLSCSRGHMGVVKTRGREKQEKWE